MNELKKLAGGSRQELVVGSTKYNIPSGFAAYALRVRVDETNIAAIEEVRSKGAEAVEVTDKSWQGEDLMSGEEIFFEHPIRSITLTNATDSIFLYLRPYL